MEKVEHISSKILAQTFLLVLVKYTSTSTNFLSKCQTSLILLNTVNFSKRISFLESIDRIPIESASINQKHGIHLTDAKVNERSKLLYR